MKITVRCIMACVSLTMLALTLIATSSFAQTPEKSIKDQMVGHWQLVSITIQERTPYGPNPLGSMFIDAAGHFSVIVVSSGDARSVSYFGTYTINADNTVTTHLEASSGGGENSAGGHEMTRLLTFNGDELVVANETANGPGALRLTWKRAN
jgi:hypothetical protein